MDTIFARLKAVTFDAAGTLLSVYPSVGEIYAEMTIRHGLALSPVALESAFRRAFQKMQDVPRTGLSEETEVLFWQRLFRETLAGLGQPRDFDALFWEVWHTFAKAERWQLSPNALPIIMTLKQRGYRVAVLSNWDSQLRQILTEMNILYPFEHIFISSEIGIEKPHLGIFRHVEAVMQLGPTQILHIGDSRVHDIDGARSAGWPVLLYQPSAENPDISTITRYEQLLPLLPPITGL